MMAVVAAAFILGWLLRSPSPAESEPDEVAVTSSTALTGETVVASTTTRPPTTTTTEPPEMVGLEVPLSEAVPGFTDTITMTHWDEERIDVLRWRASQSAPELVLSLDQGGAAGWFAGLDASGRWAAQVNEAGLLAVHPVPDPVDGDWPEDFDRAVDVRVSSATWHDTDPGRLAWVSCSLNTEDFDEWPRRVATLYTYDVESDVPAEPAAEFTIDGGCVMGWGISPHLISWGAEGLRYWTEGEHPHELLIQPDGTKIGLTPDSESHVADASADGTFVVVEHDRPGEPYLLSSDGTTRSPVPGLAENERLDNVLWSPDGSLLAYGARRIGVATTLIRVVEIDTGAIVAQVPTRDYWELWPATWSTDSHFLLIEQRPRSGPEDAKELVFYDTASGSTVAVPVPFELGDIQVTDPAPPAELVAHYPLDGDATDLTGRGHDGTIIGGATTTNDRFGTPVSALSFDGDNDYIVIDMTPRLATEAVSMTAWVKMASTGTLRTEDQDQWYVVSYGDQGHFLAVDGPGTAVLGLHAPWGWGDCHFRGTDTTVDDGLWHHLAMIRDHAGTTRLYIDGAAQDLASIDSSTSADPTAATCLVGPAFDDQAWIGGNPPSRDLFNGAIDEVRIYTGVLTDDEIAALASVPLLTAEDLPGDWNEVDDDASFWLPEGLCPQIASHQEIFLDNVRSDSPNYSTPLIEARFMREESLLSQGIYASGYMAVDQLFTHFNTLLTDCAVETDGAVTTTDHTASIDLIDLPGLDRDYVAVEWIIDRVSWSSEETRLVIVNLGDVLLVLNAWQGWWAAPEESLGVSDAEFEAIVNSAATRAVGDADP